jgi:hypothetical protein
VRSSPTGNVAVMTTEVYPRALRPKEENVLEFVLPEDRPGYRNYRNLIRSMVVLSLGRRGRGNFVLGDQRDTADLTSPLPPVIAYGMVETTQDQFSVTVRECIAGQIDVEVVSRRGEELPDHFEEKRRWTYSPWSPGKPSPATNLPVREVAVGGLVVLAVSREERRLWIYDGRSGMNLLIPVTNYYNELMLQKKIRDPGVALNPNRLYSDLSDFTDAEMREAFIAYNASRRRVDIAVPVADVRPTGLIALLKRFVRKAR